MNIDLKKELNFKDTFSICVPEEYTFSTFDNEETCALRLGQNDPIYIKKFVLDDDSRALQAKLEDRCYRFVADGIGPILDGIPNASILYTEMDGGGYAQGVVALSDKKWWIFRTIGKVNYPYYFLVHWLGEKESIPLSIAVISSFTIGKP